jgi:rSAM/selenodomain-associated transferase 1
MQTSTSRTKLVIFLKAPRAGSVKTRLAAGIGAAAALAAYRRITQHLLANLNGLAGMEIRFSPDDAEVDVQEWLGQGFEYHPQGKGDLGEKLHRTFDESFSQGFARILAIGSDCPFVTRSDIEVAWASLASHDVVIGPASDGGYWLIGLSGAQPGLFENIPWSTEKVLESTLQRIQAAGLSYARLRELCDIDTQSDWQRYIEWEQVH